jgi:hypothetical protein
VLVHGAARIFEAQQNLILVGRNRKDRRDFFAQRSCRGRSQVAFEIEHEQTRTRQSLLVAGTLVALALFSACFDVLLRTLLAAHRIAHRVGGVFEAPVQVLDDEAVVAPAAPRPHGQND